MGLLIVFVVLSVLATHAEVIYKVRLTSNDGGRVVSLSAEDYVAAVLAGESGTFKSEEALKAMAVAARTYAARLRGRHSNEGYDFCATTHCQRLEPGQVTPRLSAAARATAGELLWFEAQPAFAAYARNCGGTSEAGGVVWPDVAAPYLRVHTDPYCRRDGVRDWSWEGTAEAISRALLDSKLRVPQPLEHVAVLGRTGSGRARLLQLQSGSQTVSISASSFRFAVGRALGWNTLRSEEYEIQNRNGHILFHGRGEGHGVGLCQDGAEQMGLEGRVYREILAFYYPGTTMDVRAKGSIRWTRLGGEGVNIFTTLPNRDARVLPLAEEVRREVENRLHLTAKEPVDIRVHPDIDTFRNTTGEPGWVAARSSRSGIDLQPPELLETRHALRSTVKHELLHVYIEREAVPNLPVWFREGLVEWLSRPPGPKPFNSKPASDDDLRQRQNPGQAARAYADAEQQVAGFVNRYGEGTVLGWLKRGLPPEVKNSIANRAATNSR